MMVEKEVSLRIYEEKYKRFFGEYSLEKEQLAFTAPPLDALASCLSEKERNPVVIFAGEEIAGFFVLHAYPGSAVYSDNKKCMLLRAYSISSSHQGKGIATKSMALLEPFVKVHFPDVNEIVLAVNAANKSAQHVYRKSGFADTGKKAAGRSGIMFIWHKMLNEGDN
ncbi:GNAT family N-acetyltransferase [Bacillus sp. 1P06AnD]|uniref:GNAT family N-acetyltransferase n=1 Tax=Bacillus sp. 1P06AnD TaxID=3132208 RepID=UPI0039A10E19